jgi:SAM-dependent methyltransferase
VIWACESLCHAFHKIDFYKEAYRLLKPGGRLICAEYLRTKRPLEPEGETLLHEWLNGWSIADIDTSEEHAKHAELSGFSDIQIDDITRFTKPSLRNLHYVSQKLWQLGIVLKKIRLRNDVNHGNHYSSIKQYEALENNSWRYGLLSMIKK